MRIGEFANKHGSTIDTIRHYLDLGLLMSEKIGGQYRFNDKDSLDMDKILELKELDFSLTEIGEILSYYRLAGDINIEYRNYYISTLETQKENFCKEIKRYEKMKKIIDRKIVEFQNPKEEISRLGIPINFLEILGCPLCNKELEISNGTLEKNMVMSGKIKCICGFSAKIENGIYVDEEIDNNLLVKKQLPTKKEFLGMSSTKFINFYYNAMSKLTEYITRYSDKPKLILELDTCAGAFLTQYVNHLLASSIYILTCNDEDKLSKMKKNIEINHKDNNIIFLSCQLDRLPIKKSSIDLIIDHGMSKEFNKLYNKDLQKIISSLLKEKGLLVGSYNYVEGDSKFYNTLEPKLKRYYNKEMNLNALKDEKIVTLEVADIGPIVESEPYNLEIKDRELYSLVYAGRKEAN